MLFLNLYFANVLTTITDLYSQSTLTFADCDSYAEDVDVPASQRRLQMRGGKGNGSTNQKHDIPLLESKRQAQLKSELMHSDLADYAKRAMKALISALCSKRISVLGGNVGPAASVCVCGDGGSSRGERP